MKNLIIISTLVVFLVPALCLADTPLEEGIRNGCTRVLNKAAKKSIVENYKINECVAAGGPAMIESIDISSDGIKLYKILNGSSTRLAGQAIAADGI